MIINNTKNTITVSTPLIEDGEQFDGSISLLIKNINYVKKHIYNNHLTIQVNYNNIDFTIFEQIANPKTNKQADELINKMCKIINSHYNQNEDK